MIRENGNSLFIVSDISIAELIMNLLHNKITPEL